MPCLRCRPLAFRAAASIVLFAAGCASNAGRLVDCPLSIAEQRQAVLKIAPQGTPREEALRRLKARGIEFDKGQSESTYYCYVWKRPHGESWPINVALLFDEQGKLYGTRSANAETAPLTGRPTGGATRSTGNAPSNGASSGVLPSPGDDEDESPLRVPFAGSATGASSLR